MCKQIRAGSKPSIRIARCHNWNKLELPSNLTELKIQVSIEVLSLPGQLHGAQVAPEFEEPVITFRAVSTHCLSEAQHEKFPVVHGTPVNTTQAFPTLYGRCYAGEGALYPYCLQKANNTQYISGVTVPERKVTCRIGWQHTCLVYCSDHANTGTRP